MNSSAFFFFGLTFAVYLGTSQAYPVDSADEPTQLEEVELFGRTTNGGELIRMKRASCDLFGFESSVFTPKHAVCAAHCIWLGNRGGECKGTVCECRK